MKNILFVFVLLITAASVNAQTITLHIAIQQGDVNKVRTMLQNGSDVNRQDRMGNTALGLAAFYDRQEIARMLAEYGANLDGVDKHYNTPLIICAIKGHYEVARYLVEQGAYIDHEGKDGQTALMHAAVNFDRESNLDVVELLVSNGADINLMDKYNRTALDYAGTQEIKDYLVSQGAMKGSELK